MNSYEIKSYEDIRDSLRVRVMDIKENAETLQNAVFEPVGCGLALVAYMELPDEIAEGGIANVPRGLIEKMPDVDARKVLEDAMEGSIGSDDVKLCAIQDMLMGPILGEEPENYLESGRTPEDGVLVLTTGKGRLGASAFFYPLMDAEIGKRLGGDYYVLPSSVHEVLIMPDNGQMTPMELAKMVKEINETQVAPQDRLCNKVFRFNVETNELTVAADPDRRREMER